jgi:hypothetical protein
MRSKLFPRFIAIVLVALLFPASFEAARAGDVKWEYKVVALTPLILTWMKQPSAKPTPDKKPSPTNEKDDLFSIASDFQKSRDDAFLPRFQAFCNEQGHDGWEMCGFSDGTLVFKRPLK